MTEVELSANTAKVLMMWRMCKRGDYIDGGVHMLSDARICDTVEYGGVYLKDKTVIKKENIKVAYLLLVHNKPEQLNLFIRQLREYGDCDIYIHVDKKNQKMLENIETYSNVHVISKYEVSWASFSMMLATIALMRAVVNSGKNFTHIYYGSGDDLLVKNGMYEYLAEHSKSVFMNLYWGGTEVTDSMRASARYKVRWPQWLKTRKDYSPARFIRILIQVLAAHGLVLRKNKISIDHLNLKIYCGSQWFIAPFETINYFVDYLDDHPEYIEYWEDALAPDEFFFQTILMNSKWANLIEQQLMFHRAGHTFGTKNHPVIISEQNIDEINEEKYFTARKFSMKEEPKAFYYYIEKVNDAYNQN